MLLWQRRPITHNLLVGVIGRFLGEQETGGVEIFDDAALLSLIKGSASGGQQVRGAKKICVHSASIGKDTNHWAMQVLRHCRSPA